MSSLSSDTFLTTSSSSGSPSSSVENISTSIERRELSVFTFISPTKHQSARPVPAPLLHPPNHYLASKSTEFGSIYANCSPSLSPTYCSCVNNDIGTYHRSNGIATATSYVIDPCRLDDPEVLHWKYHHHYGRKAIVQPQSTKCSCHVHHSQCPQMNHVLSDTSYTRLLPRTRDGILLRSLEKGVLFPVIHWSSLYENSTHPTREYPTLLFNQGIYKELKSVIPADICLQRDDETFVRLRTLSQTGSNRGSGSLSPISSRKPTTWLIIGYKSLEKTLDSSLEASWKEWTGIRHVYLHLRSDFEIRKISFLHRVHPIDNMDLFMYVVHMEIGNVDERNRIWLLDFVQRMRVERMKGFLTVYSEVEQEISSIGDEYRKYSCDTQDDTTAQIQPPPVPPRSHSHRTERLSPATTHSPFNVSLATSLLDHHTSEINGNIKFMEKLLEEINMQPLGDYF